MSYKLNEKSVIYYNKTGEIYDFELIKYKEYFYENKGFDDAGNMYYAITVEDGVPNWYRVEDFLSLAENRKLKIKKLNTY